MSESQVSVEEFERRLAHGLGRPVIYLRDHDAEPYRDVILDACLHNRCYDHQVEGSRAGYMLQVVNATGTREFYRDHVIRSLSESTEREKDMEQRFHFARLLAQEGDEGARRAMYESFRADPFDVATADQFVHLDGTAGFLFVAQKLGELRVENPQWDEGLFQFWAEETLGDAEMKDALDRAAESSPAIENFKRMFQQATKEYEQARSGSNSTGLSYDEVKQLIHEDGPRKNHRGWGRDASDADILRAAEDFVHEQDPDRLKAYLSIFADRSFPLGHDALLKIIDSYAGKRIAFRALKALARLSHPDIRKLTFQLVESQDVHRSLTIELLMNNAEPGDGSFVETWCFTEKDDFTLHGLAPDSIRFFDQHPDNEKTIRLLRSFYDRVACGFCRKRWVEKLIELNALTEEIRAELPYHSYDEVRALA